MRKVFILFWIFLFLIGIGAMAPNDVKAVTFDFTNLSANAEGLFASSTSTFTADRFSLVVNGYSSFLGGAKLSEDSNGLGVQGGSFYAISNVTTAIQTVSSGFEWIVIQRPEGALFDSVRISEIQNETGADLPLGRVRIATGATSGEFSSSTVHDILGQTDDFLYVIPEELRDDPYLFIVAPQQIDPNGQNVSSNKASGTIFRVAELTVSPVPEPTTMLLLGSGLIGLAGFGRKKLFKKR